MKQKKYINPFTQVLLCEPAWNVMDMVDATGTLETIDGDKQGGDIFSAPRRLYI